MSFNWQAYYTVSAEAEQENHGCNFRTRRVRKQGNRKICPAKRDYTRNNRGKSRKMRATARCTTKNEPRRSLPRNKKDPLYRRLFSCTGGLSICWALRKAETFSLRFAFGSADSAGSKKCSAGAARRRSQPTAAARRRSCRRADCPGSELHGEWRCPPARRRKPPRP